MRNLFDWRGDVASTLDGFPNPAINTLFDDYSAYRTETGLDGSIGIGTGFTYDTDRSNGITAGTFDDHGGINCRGCLRCVRCAGRKRIYM